MKSGNVKDRLEPDETLTPEKVQFLWKEKLFSKHNITEAQDYMDTGGIYLKDGSEPEYNKVAETVQTK